MAKQKVSVELFYDGVWNDIVLDDDVLSSAIVIKRGQGDESSAPRPATVTLRLANDDDRYRTSNPLSPLYGKAGRNTPIRVSVGTSVRVTAEVSSWATDQTRDFRRTPRRGSAWCDIQAGGLLQRVGQWTEVLQSPITRQLSSYSSSLGLWPFEDDDGSAILTNVAGSLVSGTFTGNIDFRGDDGSEGSDQTLIVGSGASLRGTFKSVSTSGWQTLFHAKLAAAPSSATYSELFALTLSNGNTVRWSINNANYQVVTASSDGTVLSTVTVLWTSTTDPTTWVRYRLKMTVSAGTVSVEPAWYDENAAAVYGTSGTYAAAATGALRGWSIQGSSWTVDAAYSHVMGTSDSTLNLTSNYDAFASFNGYDGEKTAARWVRLMTENGLNYQYDGDFGTAALMGPQKSDTLPELIREIRDTEDGLIYDSADEVEITLRLRDSRYNQTPKLELFAGDMPALPREVTDDLDISNVVTAQQRNGGSATSRDDITPFVGTAPPPDGAGEYRRTVNVNIFDENDLSLWSDWYLSRGTVDLPRFPQVEVNMDAVSASTRAAAESVNIGDVITITGIREYVIRLNVLGYTETIGTHSRSIVFTCAPDQQFVIALYDDARYDSASSYSATNASVAATSLVIFTTNFGDVWSTVDTPYDILVAGEQMTVKTMGAVTGTGPYQQIATVTRGVNGIVKFINAGDDVHIATPGRYAL
ncbi:MAG: hypothetical protein JXA67_20370 [Micromonosporaceae bacterium]|nr:hypothetical protein [Micromonosporaceae bacterium]